MIDKFTPAGWAIYDSACRALYERGFIRSDTPRNLQRLNWWLKLWTSARVHRHHAKDGGQLYWHDEPEMFYRETVDGVFHVDSRTFGEWIEDYIERHEDALRRS